MRKLMAMAILTALVAFPSGDQPRAQNPVYQIVRQAEVTENTALPEPEGPVVLTVTGAIGRAGEVRFDMPTLEKLGLVRYRTSTNWTPGPVVFEGVLLETLLKVVGAKPTATTLTMTALNEYQTPIPISDAETWPVMLAVKQDGEYMSRRDRGPIWVVYPQDDFPQLSQREFITRWVWQLKAIAVE
jgi:hypothetical protein